MKNVITKIQNTKGFVSIEAILVIGAVVLVAGLILFFLNGKAGDIGKASEGQIKEAESKIQVDPTTGVGGTDKLDFNNAN